MVDSTRVTPAASPRQQLIGLLSERALRRLDRADSTCVWRVVLGVY